MMNTKNEFLIPLDYVVSSYIYEREAQLFPNLYHLIAVLYFSKWHLDGRFGSMFPVDWSRRDLVKNFQKYPSAAN